jgi:hypothetical protein
VNDHPVRRFIQDELNAALANVIRPNVSQYKTVEPTDTFFLFGTSENPLYVSFDKNHGSIASMYRNKSVYWADETAQLSSYVYITFNETDFEKLINTYGNSGKIQLFCSII